MRGTEVTFKRAFKRNKISMNLTYHIDAHLREGSTKESADCEIISKSEASGGRAAGSRAQ
jgi:hypothetical protein